MYLLSKIDKLNRFSIISVANVALYTNVNGKKVDWREIFFSIGSSIEEIF